MLVLRIDHRIIVRTDPESEIIWVAFNDSKAGQMISAAGRQSFPQENAGWMGSSSAHLQRILRRQIHLSAAHAVPPY